MRRRDFLQAGTFALPALAAQGAGSAPKSCILLMLVGGPSQLDTFDPKPEAPSGVRGPFRAISTSVAGMQVSELLPRLARQAKKYALIRSMHHDGPSLHDSGHQLAQTGRVFEDGLEYPHIGAVLKYWNGARHVILPGPIGQTGGNLAHGQSAGFLGGQFATEFIHPRTLVCEESEAVRSRYGDTLFGQSCLGARLLVEDGVRCVTVNMFDTVFGAQTWDMHGYSPFSALSAYRDYAGPMFDMAVSALIADLDERGLLATTMVVGLSEFGRTPRINPTGGRDHWTRCWTTLVAGGGIQGGQVYGSSDATGAEPREKAVTPGDLVATIYRALGVPLDLQLPGPGGRLVPLLESGVRPHLVS